MSDRLIRISPDESGAGGRPPRHAFTHDAMACTFSVRIQGEEGGYARQAARAAFAELERVEQLLSRFVSHSDVAQINRLRPGQSVRVQVETIECLRLAAEMYRETNGAFDITFRSAARHAEAAGARLSPLVLDPLTHAVGVQAEGVVLDLGGIGKGYAVDRMVAILREWSINAALLDSGQSAVYALGPPPAECGWRVALRHPRKQNVALGCVELRDCALGGSGQLLHGRHIVDPRTGQPARATAAWALAASAALADALATAFMVMSPAEVRRVCEHRGEVSGVLCMQAQQGLEVTCIGPHASLVELADAPE